jgi:hypothetical protein
LYGKQIYCTTSQVHGMLQAMVAAPAAAAALSSIPLNALMIRPRVLLGSVVAQKVNLQGLDLMLQLLLLLLALLLSSEA